MLHPRQLLVALAGVSSVYLLSLLIFPTQIKANPLNFERSGTLVKPSKLISVYEPPTKAAPRTTQGSVGTRGCEQSNPGSLNLLVPGDHTGQTTQGHPSFFWYVSNPVDVPMEFALVEPKVSKPLYVKQVAASGSEVVKLTLPQNLPSLEIGKEYRWSVSLICNPMRRSNDIHAHSWIERSLPPTDFSHKLASAQTEYERTIVYAQAGFWYDALSTITNAQVRAPQNAQILSMRQGLLEQVGLSQMADRPLGESVRVVTRNTR